MGRTLGCNIRCALHDQCVVCSYRIESRGCPGQLHLDVEGRGASQPDFSKRSGGSKRLGIERQIELA
mgnify:CR=1 FL=1